MFTGMRAAVMSYILLPLAGALEIRKTKKKVRFAEQAWLFLYYLVFWSIGMVRPLDYLLSHKQGKLTWM